MTDAQTPGHPRSYSAAYVIATLLLSSCAAQDTASPRREQTRDDSEPAAETETETETESEEESSLEDDSMSKGGSSNDEEADTPDAGASSCAEAEELAFEIFGSRCAGCHGNGKNQGDFGGVLSAGLMVASGRVVPFEPANSPVFKRVESGDMPRGAARLDAASVAVINRWIECGAAQRPGSDAAVAGDGGVVRAPDARNDAGAADARVADAGVANARNDDRDEEAEEAQKDRDEAAEEAQKDRDEAAEEAQEDLDEAADEARN